MDKEEKGSRKQSLDKTSSQVINDDQKHLNANYRSSVNKTTLIIRTVCRQEISTLQEKFNRVENKV